jgi:catechol 2,3-dioxygenase-like lactoylglutathione lyase family enzyme
VKITMRCHDLERSREFYGSILGPPRDSGPGSAATVDDPILAVVLHAGASSIDDIASELNAPVGDVLARVVRLETAGKVHFDGASVRANGH